MPADVTLTTEQKVRVSCAPVTAAGHPAAVDGPVVFEVTNGTCIVEIIDATSAWIVSGDEPGDSSVVVSADADLGAGVETISDAVAVHVTGAKATALGLVVGAPEPK